MKLLSRWKGAKHDNHNNRNGVDNPASAVDVFDEWGEEMMCKEEIQKVDEWFDNHTDNYGTYRTEREYSVDEFDLESFTDFLRNEFPDLVGIRCYIGTGDSKIWFFRDDLEKAEFY